jgi:hypothetical protein
MLRTLNVDRNLVIPRGSKPLLVRNDLWLVHEWMQA